MSGSSNSSTPIAPEPSSSRESKYYLSFLNSSSSKSIQCFFPCFFSQFLVLLSGLNINSSGVMTPPSSSSFSVSSVYPSSSFFLTNLLDADALLKLSRSISLLRLLS